MRPLSQPVFPRYRAAVRARLIRPAVLCRPAAGRGFMCGVHERLAPRPMPGAGKAPSRGDPGNPYTLRTAAQGVFEYAQRSIVTSTLTNRWAASVAATGVQAGR